MKKDKKSNGRKINGLLSLLIFSPLAVQAAPNCLSLLQQAQNLDKKGNINQAEKNYFRALACNPHVMECQFGAKLLEFKKSPDLLENKAWKRGESLAGKTLLVYSVKGNGDVLQFSRFVTQLKKTNLKKLIFLVPKSLVELFKFSFDESSAPYPIEIREIDLLAAVTLDDEGAKEVKPAGVNGLNFDKHASLLDLPYFLDIGIPDILKKPYLKVRPEKVTEYRELLAAEKKLKVGLVFSGDLNNPHNIDRSFSLTHLKSVAALPNLQFYSLQPGSEILLESAKDEISVDTSFLKRFKTYEETAALIQNLDLVIAADTSVAHLTGGLGKPVFVPLSKKTDLRYAGTGQDSFWYESMKLFRQKVQSEWEAPMEALQQAVQKMIDAKSGVSEGEAEALTGNSTAAKDLADAGKAGASAPKPATLRWSANMQELYKILASLMNDVASDQQFNNPSNRHRIENEAKRLSSLAHDLKDSDPSALDADPTVRILSTMFAQEAQQAVVELKRNNRAYARNILRAVPSYCIACHTRNSSGPQFAKLPFEPSVNLTQLERGSFFAASRQFDRAQDEFKKIVKNGLLAKSQPFQWERSVYQSLSIAIRVKKDPGQALEIVQTVLETPDAPVFLKQYAQQWKLSILEWQKESAVPLKTEEGLYTEAKRLMAKAREVQKYPMDRMADVLYLRATAIVHDLLQVAPQGNYVGEAFLLAGLCYEVLSPLRLEDLHNIYYEACIRKSPHTATAELCYQRYEESIYLGYTGSAGTDVPADMNTKLNELKVLAQPAGAEQK